MTKLYCITYRTGGTENFQWHRSASMSKAEAQAAKAETERKGYRCYIMIYDLSISIGLPETYE